MDLNIPEQINLYDEMKKDEGYIFIISRLKRFAKIAGEMISLNKIEELALECFGKSSFYIVSSEIRGNG